MEELLDNIQIIYTRKREIEELSSDNIKSNIIREKKQRLFDQHNQIIEEMKLIKYSDNPQYTYADFMAYKTNKELYWWPTRNVRINAYQRALTKKKYKNDYEYAVSQLTPSKFTRYKYKNSYISIHYESIHILILSEYKIMGYAHNNQIIFFHELQNFLNNDDYYLTNVEYNTNETKPILNNIYGAHIPSLIEFMNLNPDLEFDNKKLSLYNPLELVDKISTEIWKTEKESTIIGILFNSGNFDKVDKYNINLPEGLKNTKYRGEDQFLVLRYDLFKNNKYFERVEVPVK